MTRIPLFPITTIFLSICCWTASAAPSNNLSQNAPKIFASIDSGGAVIDEDFFIPIQIELGLNVKNFELTIQGPLRLRVLDNAPHDSGVLREQDWDDRSDWARIVRDLSIYKMFDNGELDIHAGELNGVHQGHDEIVSHYFNSTDMDHYHGGVEAFLDIGGNGLELLLDDVISPAIFSGRVFLAPFSWFSKRRISRHFQIGAHLFVDRGVPSRTLTNDVNRLVAAGASISFIALQSNVAAVDTYVSLGAMDGDAGFHGGVVADIAISKRKRQGLRFQTEFRYMGEDYHPALVNPFYNHNRRFFTRDPATGEQNTLTDHLANTSMNVKAATGFMADFEIQLNDMFRLGARYDYQARNRPHWLLFRLALTPSDNVAVSGFYAGQDIEGGAKLFSSEALMGLAYHHRIVGPLRLFSEFSRRFRRLDNDTTGSANETSLGVGLTFSH